MTDLCQGPDPNPRKPRIEVPPGATDTHIHLFGGPPSRYPLVTDREYSPPLITPEDARHLFDTIGIERFVVIQPSVYGTDNRAQLEGAAEVGLDFRAVVVVPFETSENELGRLHDQGARALRIVLAHPGGLPVSRVPRFAERIKDMSWHIQFLAKGPQLVEIEPMISRLTCPAVIDHMGMFRPEEGFQQPAFQATLRLLKAGHWVKLSGAYRLSKQTPPYPELTPYIQELVATEPDHVLWASDWPHVFLKTAMPNTTDLFDQLGVWVPDESIRRKILVDNPARLYGF